MTPMLVPFVVVDGPEPPAWRPYSGRGFTLAELIARVVAREPSPLTLEVAKFWQTYNPYVLAGNEWEVNDDKQLERLKNVVGAFVDITGRSAATRSAVVRFRQLCGLVVQASELRRRVGFHTVIVVDWTRDDQIDKAREEIEELAHLHFRDHAVTQTVFDGLILEQQIGIMRKQMAIRAQHASLP
jgi:hypothetical protein